MPIDNRSRETFASELCWRTREVMIILTIKMTKHLDIEIPKERKERIGLGRASRANRGVSDVPTTHA